MLIYQILSKFPLEVVVKLEDVKKCEGEWTVELLRKLLNQHISIKENAQCRVANVKEEYIHMIADKSNRMRYPVDIYPQQNLIKVKYDTAWCMDRLCMNL